MDSTPQPEDSELKNIIDKLANFVARNGTDFEAMTKEKQQDNPKFSFLFGGPNYAYYQMKLQNERRYYNQQNDGPQGGMVNTSINIDQQQYPPWQQPSSQNPQNFQQTFQAGSTQMSIDSNLPPWQQNMQIHMMQQQPQIEPQQMQIGAALQQSIASNQTPVNPPVIGNEDTIESLTKQAEELEADSKTQIAQSQSNLNQQYDALTAKQQEVIEKEIEKAQIDELKQMSYKTGIALIELDAKLTPIIKSCTKDSISAGKAYILANSKTMQHCDVLTAYILQRVMEIDKENGGEKCAEKFDKQLHIIYLINDVLHHASRKNVPNVLEALGKQIIPIFCTASMGLSDSDPRKERLDKLLGLWGKFGYFDDDTITKLKDPSNALAIYQACLITQYSDIVKKSQEDIEMQFKNYSDQHDKYAMHIMQKTQQKLTEIKDKMEEAKLKLIQTEELKTRELEQSMAAALAQQQALTLTSEFNQPRPPWAGSMRPPMPDWAMHPPPGWNNSGPRPINPNDWQQQRVQLAVPQMPVPTIDPNDPALIPTAPYFDLPVGLMCPLVKLEDTEYKPLDPALIRLPPPLPPSERLLAALDAFYAPPSRDRPRNLDGWEQMGLYEFFRAKVQAKRQIQNPGSKKSRSRSRSSSRSSSRSRSRSYSRSRSRSSRSRSRSRSSSRSRSRSRGRSTTPPRSRFGQNSRAGYGGPIGENRGAAMMKKMGWGGAGLGSSEQGRQAPVEGGEVRDKMDQFKGLGMPPSDPFENFRKSKSQGFIARIKSRVDDA